jgi:hypothetical protein
MILPVQFLQDMIVSDNHEHFCIWILVENACDRFRHPFIPTDFPLVFGFREIEANGFWSFSRFEGPKPIEQIPVFWKINLGMDSNVT